MGCGSSTTAPVNSASPQAPKQPVEGQTGKNENLEEIQVAGKCQQPLDTIDRKEGNTATGDRKRSAENSSDSVVDEKVPELDRIHVNNQDKPSEIKANTKNAAKPIAFDVQLCDETLISKPLPPLSAFNPPRRLEALRNAPILTAEELQQKLAAAEHKRTMVLEKRKAKRSRKTKEIAKNRKLIQSQENAEKLEKKMRSGAENREKLLTERIEKQKKRREHEKMVREKARHLKDANEDEMPPEHEVETYVDSGDEHQWDDLPTPKETDKKITSEESRKSEVEEERPDQNPLVDDFYET